MQLSLRAQMPLPGLQGSSLRRRCLGRKAFSPTQQCRKGVRPSHTVAPCRQHVVVAAGGPPASSPHLQLATAKLPADVNSQVFSEKMYQWAATLTSNGRNLPFALPIKADPLQDGFQISLLRVGDGGRIRSVADVVGSVEAVGGAGNVFFVRMFEGEGSSMVLSQSVQSSGDDQQRLKMLLAACVDIPLIMQTMPGAIKQAALMAR